jgi:hypothetical protein
MAIDGSKRISYQELLNRMTEAKEELTLSNYTVFYNPETDRRFMDDREEYVNQLDTLYVLADIVLNNFVFEASKFPNTFDPKNPNRNLLSFLKISFEGKLHIHHFKADHFNFAQCRFAKEVVLEHFEVKHWMEFFDHNQMDDYFRIHRGSASSMRVKDNICYGSLRLGYLNLEDKLELIGNVFNPRIELDSNNTFNPLRIYRSNLDRFFLRNNQIFQTAFNQHVHFHELECNTYFGLHENLIQSNLILYFNNIRGRFVMASGLNIGGKIGWHSNVYDSRNCMIDWASISGKLCEFTYGNEDNNFQYIYFCAESKDEIQEREKMDRLIEIKEGIRQQYVLKGQTRYANAVKVEVKDLETAQWQASYELDKDVRSWFNWQVRLFLKEFSAYGTDPILAISYALKLILYFGIMYFFLHNRWNAEEQFRLEKGLLIIADYYQDKGSLTEIFQRHSLIKTEANTNLNAWQIKSLPKSFRAIHFISAVWHNSRQTALETLLTRLDFLKGSWSEQSAWMRTITSILGLLLAFGMFVFSFLKRCLNALMLSINAFTTLGFGTIPAKGLTRYLLIIQGFVGWILLTIFSATLISQFLQ